MTLRAAPLLFLVVSSVFAFGCDTASVYEDCTPAKEGSGEERCMPSTFAQEDELARLAAGFVSVGFEHQPNATVSVDGAVTTTDDGGYYRYADTPFRYDVSTVVGDDVIAFHRAANRFLDLAVERDGIPRAFTAMVRPNIDGFPRAGNELLYFADGDDISGITSVSADNRTIGVLTKKFENDKARIHVVECEKGKGLSGAVSKGDVVVTIRTGDVVTTPLIVMLPVAERKSTMFSANPAPPAGFTVGKIELLADFGTQINRVLVATIALGDKVDLPVMNGANWLARTTATRPDGAVSSIGLRPFTPGDALELAFYAPPEAMKSEGDVLFAASAQGKGVFEHVLVPTDPARGGGKTIHVFSAMQEAKVPDLRPLGLPAASGEYRWTVRVFPDFSFVEDMSGIINRLYRSSSTSAPRTVVLP